MTLEQLQEITRLSPDKAVEALKVHEIELPSWKDKLVHQYDALLHPIMTDFVRYPVKEGNKGEDSFRRIPLAFQKLAVNKEAQALYYNDATRRYVYDNTPAVNAARDLLEDNIKVINGIDSTNLERAKALFKSCAVCTLYKIDTKTPSVVKGEISTSTLRHQVYSPADGYELYPYYDMENRLIGVGINYFAKEYQEGTMVTVEYFHLTVVGGSVLYKNQDNWEVFSSVSTGTDILLATYISIPQPIWGGDEGSKLVELMEELRSKNQLYIDKNQVPMYAYYKGKNVAKQSAAATETDEDARRIIEVGEDGFINPVHWKGAENAIVEQYNSLLEQYYQQIQIFDNRPNSMQTKAMSAENKEILMFDARARAKDLAGELQKMHLQEFIIFKVLTGIQFPKHKAALETMMAVTEITPYSLHTKQDMAEYVRTCIAAGAMSVKTAVTLLNEAESIEQEVLDIATDEQASNNF